MIQGLTSPRPGPSSTVYALVAFWEAHPYGQWRSQDEQEEVPEMAQGECRVLFLKPSQEMPSEHEAVAVVLKTSLLRVEPRVHEVSTKQL